jgi:hypothetical protein
MNVINSFIYFSTTECCGRVQNSCTWEVSGSNLDPEIGSHNWSLPWFSSISPCKCWDSTSNYTTKVLSHILSNSLLTNHPLIWRCTFWTTELLKTSINIQETKQNKINLPGTQFWDCWTWQRFQQIKVCRAVGTNLCVPRSLEVKCKMIRGEDGFLLGCSAV